MLFAKRNTQKTILERKSQPTFNNLVEIKGFNHVLIHENLDSVVDRLLRGLPIKPIERQLNSNGMVNELKTKPIPKSHNNKYESNLINEINQEKNNNISIYPYGVNKGKLELASKEIGINISIANNFDDSEFIVTTKNFYKKRTKFLIDAHKTNIPVYVIRKNTLNQIVSLLGTIKKQQQQSIRKSDPAIIEAENMAIELSNSNNNSKLELSPQSSYIRKLQHSIAEKYGLSSSSKNQGKSRRVVYFKY